MKKLPFEITPQIKRYLRNLIEFWEDFSYTINEEKAIIRIITYLPEEKVTDASEINNLSLWKYLREMKAVEEISTKHDDREDAFGPQAGLIEYKNIEIKNREGKIQPKTLMFPRWLKFKILNIDKIKRLLNIVEGKKDEKKKSSTKRILKSPIFDEKTGILKCGDKEDKMPYGRKEWCLYKVMFDKEREKGEPVGWDEIIEVIDQDTEYDPLQLKGKEREKKIRSIYDTYLRANKRAKKLGIKKLFEWKDINIRRLL